MRFPVNHAVPLAALIFLAGCGLGGDTIASAPLSTSGPAADYPMVIGDAYTVGSVTYTPEDRLNYDAVGHADLGAEGGNAISIAHKTLPLPSYVEVTSLDSGKTILARVERRGPMLNDRLIELSPGAAIQLGLGAGGSSAPVRVRRVNPPEGERALLRTGQRAPDRMETPKALLAVLMRKLTGAAPAPAALPTTAPSATPAPASAVRPKPARKPPLAVSAPEAVPAPATAPAQAAPPPAGSRFVQVAAFSTRERADSAAQALGGQVEPAGRLFRVRMGPYADKAEADAALAKARGAGYSDARIQNAR